MAEAITKIEALDQSRFLEGDQLQATFFANLRPETRLAVLACHAIHRSLYGLDKPLLLLGWVTIWIRDWQIPEADAVTALRYATNPDNLTEIKDATDLRNLLAKMVNETKRRRKVVADQEERRREMNGTPAQPNAATPIVEAIARGFR